MAGDEADLPVQRVLEDLNARIEQMAEEQRQVRERLDVSAQRMERLLANILQAELARLREAVATVSDTLKKTGAGVATEAASDWPESLRATAAAAREAVQRLSVLDATQAASLQSVSEELRALREELRRARGEAEPWTMGTGEGAPMPSGPSAGVPPTVAVAPLVEIVRMHMELLRLLVERGALRPGGEGTAAVTTPERAAASGFPAEEPGEGVARLRTELRSTAAALEHQWNDLKEQQDRRMELLERRLEEIRHVADHVAAQEPGRRLLGIVGVGLAFIAVTALAVLVWHRFQSTSATPPAGRVAGTPAVRGEARGEADYSELVREVDLALAREEWARAERLLQQALRLRPDAPEVRLALAALRARLTGPSGTEEAIAAAGTALACTIRDGRLCCASGPGVEQCVAWPTAAAVPLGSPTPTPRTRQRTQKGAAGDVGPLPPPLPDDDF